MTNQLMVQELLEALIKVGSKITSEKYMLLVLNTLIRDLRRDNEVFMHVKIGKTSNGYANWVNVSPEINSIDKITLRESLSVFISRIIGPSGMGGQESFSTILEYEMDNNILRSLQHLGVESI